ncbi:MAG TPA: recombinase family protein, partial [Thermomicrobiales bacterium]|nr:recombinase family protein [Thermomicrobiales bacterium]
RPRHKVQHTALSVAGLKGQISELELHILRARMRGGLLNKARRGALAQPLPVGLVRDERGVVRKDPDQEVQARIALVFATFLTVRSAGKVAATLDREGLRLPRRDRFGDLVWRRPTTSAILALLRNPAYAGAFVYGRRQGIRRDPAQRRPARRALPMAAWRVRVPDKYPAYIDWPQYEKIQAMLDDNRAEYTRDRTRGVPRAGAALLQGIAYCGESGHKLTVVYRPQAQYRCVELRRRYGGPLCQTIPAAPVDARVVAAFFAALQPAELDLYDRALREQHAAAERVAWARAQQLERLRYEAALAERQFRRVDPDNRLVAAELEWRWEQALRDVRQAEADLAARAASAPPFVLSAPLRAALADLGTHLPALWASGALSREQQKALLRCLIDKVVLHRPVHDRIRTRIVWRGGDTTTFDVPVPVGAFAGLAAAPEMEERILAHLAAGRTDREIAEALTSEGYRSPRREVVIESTVRNIRLKHRLLIARRQADPRRPTGHLSVTQVAQRLDVAEHWVYARIYRQQILVARDATTGLYLFPDHPDALALLAQLKAGAVKTVRLYKEHHHE